MALPKHKSRPLVVNEHRFRYVVSCSRTEVSGVFSLNVVVQSEEYNGRKLLVRGMETRDFWLDLPDVAEDHAVYRVVTPKQVAAFVEQAIQEGWEYEQSGGDFVLEVSNPPLD